MCFCTCTPQTSAHKSWAAASALYERSLLENGSEAHIAAALRESGVRFHNNKAAYIVLNRERFFPGTKTRLAGILSGSDPHSVLHREVAGWGMKEAAHFLRNIGAGEAVCILDRHILRRLAAHAVIDTLPASLSQAVYRTIDGKMKEFARLAHIPLPALDLVFWYEETGELFK